MPHRTWLDEPEAATVYGRVALWCAGHAWSVIAGYVVAAAAALVLTVSSLDVNTDPGEMIAKDLDFRAHFADYVAAFPQLENTFLVVVDADEPDLGREAAKALAQSFRARNELFEAVYAPGTGKFFDDYGILYLDTDKVRGIARDIADAAPLLTALAGQPNLAGLAGLTSQLAEAAAHGAAPPAAATLFDEMAETAAAEVAGAPRPLDWAGLGTANGNNGERRWFVVAKPRLDYTKLDPAEAAMTEARQIVADPEISRSGRVRVALTGEAAVNAEEFEAVIEGATLAGLVSLVLVTLVIAIGMPALRLIVPALAMLVLGFLINAGFATLTVGELNMISVAFAVLFIGLGIDYAVHMLLRYAEAVRAGADVAAGIITAADGAGPALALCTLTTSIAFLAFTPTDFVGMAQLGIIAAGGIVIAFAASLTLLPAVLALLPVPARWRDGAARTNGRPRPTGLPALRPVATVVVAGLAVGCLFLLPQARFDGDPVNLKDPDSATVREFKQLLASDSGRAYAVQVLAASPDEARRLASALRGLAAVEQVRLIDDLVPGEQEAKLTALSGLAPLLPKAQGNTAGIGDKARRQSLARLVTDLRTIERADKADPALRQAAQRLRRGLELAAADPERAERLLLSLENALFARLPQTVTRLATLASAKELTPDDLEPALRSAFLAADGRWRIEVTGKGDMRDEVRLRQFVRQVLSVAPHATGAPVEITGAADVVSRAIGIACLAAFGLVILLVAPVLRRPLDILLVITPIALSALLLVGYTVIFEAPFNFANVIVLPLLLGLGIDSAIHYVMRARELRDHAGASPDVTATSTPRAVLISALTTIGSFGTLWLSPHKGMASMGELLTIAIFITLMSTLIVLPQLIEWTIARRTKT